jgi:hypothetical protein
MAFIKEVFLRIISSGDQLSSLRFAMILTFVMSLSCVYGTWSALTLYYGAMQEIPGSVITLTTLLVTGVLTTKYFQGKTESKDCKDADGTTK